MTATSIKNVLDFVCDLNALVGVHQHPVDQQLGQLGGQRVRIENCLGRFLAAVLPCLLVLFLLRLCQCCGIGVFRFQKQLVTRSLFCLVGVQVDSTREPLSLMPRIFPANRQSAASGRDKVQ